MKTVRLTRPPAAVRTPRNDNLTLIPGNLLPRKAQLQSMANRLPRRAVLIILPTANESQKRTLLAVAKVLSNGGRQVSVVPATDLENRQCRL